MTKKIDDTIPSRDGDTRQALDAEGSASNLDELVREVIGRIADKWTMLTLEALEEHGRLRFTQVATQVGGISQKMLSKTLRQMERDGLVTRTVHPVIPPRVDYELTDLGRGLSAAFCEVWHWAERHQEEIEHCRREFESRKMRSDSFAGV